jgi:hypothetical protein
VAAVKLGSLTFGYIVSVTLAAAAGFLVLKWIGNKWNIPVVSSVAKTI